MKDLVIIGGGPGGYVAAIRASQLGMKVALVEKEHLGGICLNWGCIPSKALLHIAEIYNEIKKANEYGIKINGDVKPDIKKIIGVSREVAQRISKGVEYLMNKNKIEVIRGEGKLLPDKKVEVSFPDGKKEVVQARNIIIAVGARARSLPSLPIDGKNILSYKHALAIDYLPESMVIVGSGPIGVEFAYFFASLGTRVTLVEIMDRIVPLEDEEVSKELERAFRNMGITIFTSTSCKKVEKGKNGLNVLLETPAGPKEISCTVVLSAVGINPNTENIGLEKIGIKTENGKIVVDEMYFTGVEGIYAIGDCINRGPALAHAASAEGITCVEYIAGKRPRPVDYNSMPSCIYTIPQIASVGLTEKKAREMGYSIKVGKFPFTASGKASAIGHRAGFVKLIYDARWGELLGAHLIGHSVTEMISELVVAKNLETTWWDILKSVHPHPTLSEAIGEATAAALGEPIHI